jgi:cyclopropane-fatty-acyl-phospholipid synthase
MVAAVLTTLDALKKRFVDCSWPPAVNLARNAVLRTFSGLEVGSLLIIDEPNGMKHIFGRGFAEDRETEAKKINNAPSAEIVVKRDTFWLRLFLYADVGFAEGYMLDDFECNDLTSFLRVRYLIPNFWRCCPSEIQLTHGFTCSYSS